MSRDWKRDWQRPGQGTFKERRDRSPLARPKAVDSNSGTLSELDSVICGHIER